MRNNIWEQFMIRLVEDKDKLDEFCNLADTDIEAWLVTNDMGVTIDQLYAASPKIELSDAELEDVAGGKVTIHSLQNTVKTEANRWFSSRSLKDDPGHIRRP